MVRYCLTRSGVVRYKWEVLQTVRKKDGPLFLIIGRTAPHRVMTDHIGPCQTVPDHTGRCWTAPNRTRPCRTVSKCTAPRRTALDGPDKCKPTFTRVNKTFLDTLPAGSPKAAEIVSGSSRSTSRPVFASNLRLRLTSPFLSELERKRGKISRQNKLRKVSASSRS